MIEHTVEIKLTIDHHPKRCDECPMFQKFPYQCHNERGMEGDCKLGYMNGSDMRDFDGRRLWRGCMLSIDPRVTIKKTED